MLILDNFSVYFVLYSSVFFVVLFFTTEVTKVFTKNTEDLPSSFIYVVLAVGKTPGGG